MSNVTKEFISTDTGAPTLPGATAGNIITLLDAVLINGYNSTTATSVTVSGGIATYNLASNTYTAGQCLLLAGATGSYTALNGEFYVTTVTGTSFSFATTAPDGTATGTITAKVAPLGWTAAFGPTANVKAYRQGSGNQWYMQVDSSSSQQPKFCLFETMSALNTGTNQTPTAAQNATLATMLVSTTATTAANKGWYIIGNDRSFYLFVSSDASVNWTSMFLGDFTSYRSGDIYNCMASGTVTVSLTNPLTSAVYFATSANATTITAQGKYVFRPYTGLGSSTNAGLGLHSWLAGATTTFGLTSTILYPSPADGSLILNKFLISDGFGPRGELPGCYAILHSAPFTATDTFDGAGDTAGKKFRVAQCLSAATTGGSQVALQRLSPWY